MENNCKITENTIVYPLTITNIANGKKFEGKGWLNKKELVTIVLNTGETISGIYNIDKKENFFILNNTITIEVAPFSFLDPITNSAVKVCMRDNDEFPKRLTNYTGYGKISYNDYEDKFGWLKKCTTCDAIQSIEDFGGQWVGYFADQSVCDTCHKNKRDYYSY